MAISTILSPGAKVGGKYEVVEVIGFGGMGVVYKVREQVGAVSRIRALKTVLPQFASDAAVVGRFRQEAEKMCMLEHENIVPVLSYSEEGEFPYLVMPFIEGQTLKEYLTTYTAAHGRSLPLSEVMEIGLELVRGLEVAHRFVNPDTRRPQPMVHRDIKPGNIMVRVENQSGERDLKVLIMDFGIAKVLSDQDSGHSLTEVIGTVKYASPEQIRRGKDIDPRADIYSLGMVLYELYAGQHMFTGMSEHSVLMRMMQRDLQDLEIPFPEGTPERFRQLIQRCVAVDRERRFANVGEVRTLMRRIVDEDSERVATEAQQARDLARAERARAVERGAEEFASRSLAEGDELLAQGDASIAGGGPKQAVSTLRAAAEVFARAAQESAEGRERARLRSGLADLGKLQAAAAALDVERLAPQAAAAAIEAMRSLESALESGDLTGGGRALAQAERAWRDAEAQAKQQGERLAAVADCERLEAALAASRAEIARLPERLRGIRRWRIGRSPNGAPARPAAPSLRAISPPPRPRRPAVWRRSPPWRDAARSCSRMPSASCRPGSRRASKPLARPRSWSWPPASMRRSSPRQTPREAWRRSKTPGPSMLSQAHSRPWIASKRKSRRASASATVASPPRNAIVAPSRPLARRTKRFSELARR